MSEYIIPTENLICFRQGGPRVDSEPLSRASVASVRSRESSLTGRDFVLLGCTAVLVAAIGLMYLLQAAEITGISYRVYLVRSEVSRLEQENSVLAVEIAEMERLDRIERDAEALGLTYSSKIQFLQLGATDENVASDLASAE